MKLLLVAAGDEAVQALGDRLAPLGYTVEHSAEPVRAIANLDDIDPQAILFSAADFPRHWKTMLKVVRERWDRKQMPFLLAAPADLEMEEAAKAAHLGANGIVGAEPASAQELSRIEMILRRARQEEPPRRSRTRETSRGSPRTRPTSSPLPSRTRSAWPWSRVP